MTADSYNRIDLFKNIVISFTITSGRKQRKAATQGTYAREDEGKKDTLDNIIGDIIKTST